jgi:hypothetical protein
MKMHHLDPETVEKIMTTVKKVVDSGEYPMDTMDEIFKLSGVDGKQFLESKNNPAQAAQVNFELDREQGIRFFDPFNFYTNGIYKDIDGWSVWTQDNLKEPWT